MRLYFRGIMENYPGLLKVASASLGEKLPPKLQLTASPPAWGGGGPVPKGARTGRGGFGGLLGAASFWQVAAAAWPFPRLLFQGPSPQGLWVCQCGPTLSTGPGQKKVADLHLALFMQNPRPELAAGSATQHSGPSQSVAWPL